MHHIAIMKKSWKLIDKILSGSKTIESRWYSSKIAPWNKIKQGETVFFKNSGSPVSAKAEVSRVLQFSDLNSKKVKDILVKYADSLGIDNIPNFLTRFRDKKYCILVFLKNPEKITPFGIDKTGFGLMSAWISVEDINRIRRLGTI
ncbi:hypothetical protein GF358_00590 [Candidatus Woesearchaeota archaeon]|nr:hypothetical protein [Candidatus Woesearchaeota archaeon]